MIRREGKKWVVRDSSGEKVLGRHVSRGKALAQLRAIEINKKKRKGG